MGYFSEHLHCISTFET